MVGRGDAWRRRHNPTTGRAALRTDYTLFSLVNTGLAFAVLFIMFLVYADVDYASFMICACLRRAVVHTPYSVAIT
jgi:hypothetical protein